MIGTTVSRYRILSKLGGGGMGVVYEAEDAELGRHVAIKFLPEELAESEISLERFKREARAASALNHANICTIHDIGVHDGKPFIVMERLVGATLKDEIGPGGLPADRVLALGVQIAEALDAAHRAGIVHRDVKPSNLFVTDSGVAKILDFGLAKRTDDSLISTVDTVSYRVAPEPRPAPDLETAAGDVVGTVRYMSPEQARGSKVDARSDLYSLGVVLYQMATGRLPFENESDAEFLGALRGREPVPAPRRIRPAIPPLVERIILGALEKELPRRYQCAADLAADLRLARRRARASWPARLLGLPRGDLLAPQRIDVAAARRRRSRLAGAAALAAAVALAYLGLRDRTAGASGATSSAPVRTIAVLPFVNLSPEKEQEYFSDGISEDLLNLLAKIPELRVTPRTSSFAFKGKEVGIPEIARQLRVAHLLEGSVRKSGNRVRVTAKLVDAASDTQLWSRSWDRELDDIFAIQDEIAADVVRELKVTLLGPAPKSRATSPEAYSNYLQAIQLGRQATGPALEQSDELLRQVLRVDPRYAPAWDERARNFLNKTNVGLLAGTEGYERAREAELEALAIDPDFAPAHSRLGWVATFADNDLAAAARHFERALSLDRTDPYVLGNSAVFLLSLGRLDEALALELALLRRDPANLILLYNTALLRRYRGQLAESIATYRTILGLNPGRGIARYGLGIALLLDGDAQGALAEIEQETSEVWRRIGRPIALHALGRRAEADASLAELVAEHGGVRPVGVAWVHAYRGEIDEAFAWLEKGPQVRDPAVAEVLHENLLANLHGDPRWPAFLRRIGRAPEQLAKIEFRVAPPE
jgi:TolB-like protein